MHLNHWKLCIIWTSWQSPIFPQDSADHVLHEALVRLLPTLWLNQAPGPLPTFPYKSTYEIIQLSVSFPSPLLDWRCHIPSLPSQGSLYLFHPLGFTKTFHLTAHLISVIMSHHFTNKEAKTWKDCVFPKSQTEKYPHLDGSPEPLIPSLGSPSPFSGTGNKALRK